MECTYRHSPPISEAAWVQRLTAAGHAFLPHARNALAAARHGQDAINGLRGLLTGRLRLGTVHPAPQGLARLLGDFHRDHPAIEMGVREDHTTPLLTALASGDLDAAFVGLPPGHRLPPTWTAPS